MPVVGGEAGSGVVGGEARSGVVGTVDLRDRVRRDTGVVLLGLVARGLAAPGVWRPLTPPSPGTTDSGVTPFPAGLSAFWSSHFPVPSPAGDRPLSLLFCPECRLWLLEPASRSATRHTGEVILASPGEAILDWPGEAIVAWWAEYEPSLRLVPAGGGWGLRCTPRSGNSELSVGLSVSENELGTMDPSLGQGLSPPPSSSALEGGATSLVREPASETLERCF